MKKYKKTVKPQLNFNRNFYRKANSFSITSNKITIFSKELSRFLFNSGMLKPRYLTNNLFTIREYSNIIKTIKRAKLFALIPYVSYKNNYIKSLTRPKIYDKF